MEVVGASMSLQKATENADVIASATSNLTGFENTKHFTIPSRSRREPVVARESMLGTSFSLAGPAIQVIRFPM